MAHVKALASRKNLDRERVRKGDTGHRGRITDRSSAFDEEEEDAEQDDRHVDDRDSRGKTPSSSRQSPRPSQQRKSTNTNNGENERGSQDTVSGSRGRSGPSAEDLGALSGLIADGSLEEMFDKQDDGRLTLAKFIQALKKSPSLCEVSKNDLPWI